MGPPPSADQMISMLENPQFSSVMNEALQNPQLLDAMIQQNPMLRDMGPGVRQMMQSPAFRRMLTDPNMLRQAAQMQSQLGLNPFGGGRGENAFPAPGVTNTTTDEHRTQESPQRPNTGAPAGNADPFGLFGLPPPQGAAANPFAALFGNPPFGGAATGNNSAPANSTETPASQQGASAGTPTSTSAPAASPPGQNPQNPFAGLFNPALFAPQGGQNAADQPQNPYANLLNNPLFQDPALLNQMMQTLGGGQHGSNADTGANPLAGLFPGMMGQGASAAQDTRPPEERYAEQLRQLNEMGFYEFERNIEALRRTGGSVQGAIEYLLSNT